MPGPQTYDVPDGDGIIATLPTPAAQEAAYQHWTGTCQHSAARVSQLTGIPAATIRQWAMRGRWRQRAMEESLDVAPHELRQATGALLQVAALHAAHYVLRVATGQQETTRAQWTAARDTLHMAGWAPTHYLPANRERAAPRLPELPANLDTLSPDELRALERELSGT